MAAAPNTLDVWDCVTFILMVILSSLIAFYHVFKARKSKNTKDFLVSSTDIGFLPVVLSSVATAFSAVSLQGFPLETYMFGIQFVFLCVAPYLSMSIFAHLFLPVYFNLGVSSIFQYLEYRFGRPLRMTASLVNTVQVVLYTSCIIYAPALALNQVTGLDLWTSVISVGCICIIYTALGGIKAVIWADCVQLIVILSAMVVVMVKGTIDVGGVAHIWKTIKENDRLNVYFYPNKYSKDTIWTYLIGGSMFFLSSITSNQMYVQRFLSNPNIRTARCSMYCTIVIITLVIMFFSFAGFIMYVRYEGCDPFLNGTVTSRDQLMPLFAVETLSFVKGFPGIFVAGILCATLSTLSSILNALSAITLTDYIRPFFPNLSENRATNLSKLLAAVYGVVCIALVALAKNMGGVVQAIFSIYGAVGGPLFAVFALGVTFPWANLTGAFVGFFVALLIGGWAAFGSMIAAIPPPHAPLSADKCNVNGTLLNTTLFDMAFTGETGSTVSYFLNTSLTDFPIEENAAELLLPTEHFFLYTLSPMWFTALSAFVGVSVGIIVSIITGVQDPEELDPGLVSPAVESFCRSLPEKYRTFLRYKSDKMKARPKYFNDYALEEEALELKVPLSVNASQIQR